jgi:hypothetical protein
MSVNRTKHPNADKFIMTQQQVNEAIAIYFEEKGYSIKFGETGNEIDVKTELGTIEFLIESRGNQALKHSGTDKIFDSSQIGIHLAEQVHQIMRFQQKVQSKSVFFVMGNPESNKIRERVLRIENALDKLGIIRCWVQEDKSVKFECGLAFLLNS